MLALGRRGWADRARLVGSGVELWALLVHLRGVGSDADQTAADYDVPRAAVAAALAYYRQHQAVIDARITLNAASLDAAARLTSGA
ncbi:MAG: hypothetical protein IT340_00380 [Chloroflexi bacterium]|nr:hypothetical protein [Chloroflexota bacterium]